MISEESIRKVYYWQYSRMECFNDKLFDLIAKADSQNRAKLRLGFPEEVSVFELWQLKGDDMFIERGWKV